MEIEKGDVFQDKDGKEYVFVGWWNTATLFGRKAMGVTYRTVMYDGVIAIPEEDMVIDENWVGGFMIGEGT